MINVKGRKGKIGNNCGGKQTLVEDVLLESFMHETLALIVLLTTVPKKILIDGI